MNEHEQPNGPQFNPNHLLDSILQRKTLRNDAALSRFLSVAPPLISKIRHGRMPVTASILIRMHEETDLSISELRELMGDRRNKFRFSPVRGKSTSTAER